MICGKMWLVSTNYMNDDRHRVVPSYTIDFMKSRFWPRDLVGIRVVVNLTVAADSFLKSQCWLIPQQSLWELLTIRPDRYHVRMRSFRTSESVIEYQIGFSSHTLAQVFSLPPQVFSFAKAYTLFPSHTSSRLRPSKGFYKVDRTLCMRHADTWHPTDLTLVTRTYWQVGLSLILTARVPPPTHV